MHGLHKSVSCYGFHLGLTVLKRIECGAADPDAHSGVASSARAVLQNTLSTEPFSAVL